MVGLVSVLQLIWKIYMCLWTCADLPSISASLHLRLLIPVSWMVPFPRFGLTYEQTRVPGLAPEAPAGRRDSPLGSSWTEGWIVLGETGPAGHQGH